MTLTIGNADQTIFAPPNISIVFTVRIAQGERPDSSNESVVSLVSAELSSGPGGQGWTATFETRTPGTAVLRVRVPKPKCPPPVAQGEFMVTIVVRS